ncbi:MAG TPA: prepilin-type N-terminal cleavage/methylation domain-containing protein [Gemmatimonadaceae bacterium]|nr:prepilin-type N-terminal cleavage/methylation domain-containing protein [Gemmatimonadaceae bacterium]
MPAAVRPASRARRGFTLVELLVALLLFDCALLAFAGDAAMLIRARGVAQRRATAAAAALNTLDRLRAWGCPAPASGQHAPAPGVYEFWYVRAASDSARVLVDSVTYRSMSRRSAFVIRSAMLC